MSSVAATTQQSAASSWQAFAAMVDEENAALSELEKAALRMTQALVGADPAAIMAANRALEGQRLVFLSANQRRRMMQRKGFGKLGIKQVCAYAPPALRRILYSRVHEVATRGIALQLTVNNNKALILAGMQRLARTVEVLQRTMTEQPGTYRRRGVVPLVSGSVIVSRKA
jgi:hypothetical protein